MLPNQMKPINIADILQIAKHGSVEEWEAVSSYCIDYEGGDEELLGVKEFLARHQNSRKALVDFVLDIEQAEPIVRKSSRLKRVPTWAAVIAASMLLVSGLYINHLLQKETLHYADPVMPVYLSADGEMLMNKAMAQYKKADYKAAQKNFAQLNSDTAFYYHAICMEMLGNYESSLALLEEISSSSTFYNKARIRQAYLYLFLKQNDKARMLLEDIKPTDETEVERIKILKLRLN
jgi:tetratricopeptide (TPR) repeat protein